MHLLENLTARRFDVLKQHRVKFVVEDGRVCNKPKKNNLEVCTVG